MPRPEPSWSVTFQWSEDFEAQVAELKQIPGRGISKALGEAFSYLYEYGWDNPLRSDFYSVFKSSYAYRFHKGYLLAFELAVEWNSGQLEKIVLQLGAIQKG